MTLINTGMKRNTMAGTWTIPCPRIWVFTAHNLGLNAPLPHLFYLFFLWRFLAGHRVNQTSQAPIGGGIRLLCDIGHRDQRSTKPLQVMICNPCPKTHTAHPHCAAIRTKTGSSVFSLWPGYGRWAAKERPRGRESWKNRGKEEHAKVKWKAHHLCFAVKHWSLFHSSS